MSEVVKSKIYQLLDTIKDESILNQLMEDVTFYTSKTDEIDKLTPNQLSELDAAITEADNNETISLDDFKKDLHEWRTK
jgi:CRISPR/Cas system CMR-associated protein Cmr5 small subunit